MKIFMLSLVSTFLVLSMAMGAETAVFKEVSGKVEYQLAGQNWKPAKVGTAIPAGSMISTGFKSSATIALSGSVVSIKPLTRLSLDALVKTQGGTQTTLNLIAGKVKTEVKPSSATNVTQFTVKSPTATASVRGTGFEFDGVNLLVNHGDVAFANQWDVVRSVQGGEISSAGNGVTVSPPVPVKPASKQVITANGGSDEVDAFLSSEDSNYGDSESELSATIETYGDEFLTGDTFSDLDTIQDLVNDLVDSTTPDETSVNIVVQ